MSQRLLTGGIISTLRGSLCPRTRVPLWAGPLRVGIRGGTCGPGRSSSGRPGRLHFTCPSCSQNQSELAELVATWHWIRNRAEVIRESVSFATHLVGNSSTPSAGFSRWVGSLRLHPPRPSPTRPSKVWFPPTIIWWFLALMANWPFPGGLLCFGCDISHPPHPLSDLHEAVCSTARSRRWGEGGREKEGERVSGKSLCFFL